MKNSINLRSAVSRYFLAVIAAVAAIILRWAATPYLGPTHPYFFACAAVIFSVWFCGTRPGVVTALTGLAGVRLWLLPQFHSFAPANPTAELSGSIAFLLLSAFIISLGEAHRRTRLKLEREIAERTRAEQALLENDQRLRIAQRAAQSGTYERNFKTGEHYSSPEMKLLYGVSTGDHAKDREEYRRMVLPEDLIKVDEGVSRVIARRGTDFHVEFRVVRSDGEMRWMETTAQIFYDDDGSPLRLVGVCSDITERKFADEALRVNEERLRIAQRAGRSGTYERNFKTGRVFTSPELREIYRFNPLPERDEREQWRSRVHPADLQEMDESVSRALAARASDCELEFRFTRGDGAIRWVDGMAKIFYDEKGEPERLVAVYTDITERKLAEENLRASEEKLLFTADRAHAGLWHFEVATMTVEWSPLCRQLYGIPREDPASFERFLEAVHPDDRERVGRAIGEYLGSGGGQDYENEHRAVLPDGTVRWIQARGSANFVEGKPIRMAGIVLDITERKRAEEAIRNNEERMRLSHRAAHSGSWEVDLKTKVILWSPEFQELWGIPVGTSKGDARSQIQAMIYPADQPAIDAALANCIGSPGGDYHVEYRITRTDGELRWMEAFGQAIRDDSGDPIRIVGVTFDITERKQAAEALRQSHQELEHRVEERTEALAASLSALEREVEIRRVTENVLRELSAAVLRLQDEERRRIARDLHDSIGQTLVALKMMLDSLAKTVGSVPRALQLVRDLDAMAAQALQEIRVTSHLLHPPLLDEIGFASAAQWYVEGFASRSGIKTKLDLSATPSLSKDKELVFFRILQEGLTNVLRHSGSASVDIQLNCDAENAVLTIKDYGKGMPANKVESFRRLGAGVGVGLGGMKQRVRTLGGQLRIESDATGTCLTATLPLAVDTIPGAGSGIETLRGMAGGLTGRSASADLDASERHQGILHIPTEQNIIRS